MLGGRISNQDEAEVEEELATLQAEVTDGPQDLPSVPNAHLPVAEPAQQQAQMAGRPEKQPMLAA